MRAPITFFLATPCLEKALRWHTWSDSRGRGDSVRTDGDPCQPDRHLNAFLVKGQALVHPGVSLLGVGYGEESGFLNGGGRKAATLLAPEHSVDWRQTRGF